MTVLSPSAEERLQTVLSRLRPRLENQISTASSVLEEHSHGEAMDAARLPAAVIFADNSEDVSAVLKECHIARVPVVAFGAGTSVEGHVTPPEHAISLDLSRMTAIVELNAADLDCRVQAGLTRQSLNTQIRDTGLFFPVDPGGEATLGGMCATRASGTAAVRYGTMKENVLGLTVVLATGEIIRTGGRVRKSSTGYDLTSLFVGSEGTLGIITEVQLRLHGRPDTLSAAVCQFENLHDAIQTAMEIIQCGIPINRVELMDSVQMDASIRFSKLEGFRPLTTLFFEFAGAPAAVQEQVTATEELALANNGLGFAWAESAEDRARLWKARHDAFWAAKAIEPTARVISTDCIVPISRLGELIEGVSQDIAESGLKAPLLGHVGDGNFHTLIITEHTPEGYERALDLDRKIVGRALALDGSCSGEHGVGMGKLEFLATEHGEGALSVMRALKTTMDPHHILNPGKLLPKGPVYRG
ncbi:D-lactate dehydrogenase/oxidoreductase [Gluconobacter thailandicus F149-1 = NBRC 100600]|uniref:D-lactate dehydrogenase (cytochrome) n=1 Tax=Gluconobacter thailandicus NBRC 3257 TaxID=1381097 RepID=A0ABQ0IZ53_GLUTH|nr:FAD-linked oxidase C-terminal domain-containing protein [Gluconobacter thailandicus]KXV53016.1 2-hydroxy-acid oxidase [Gluconobacter thailandicus]GAC86988.1 D-lactate dehydrogenase [Gluconobacter thailandicus NBRC 3255]GAD27494.1 D-lactate dehydrogenase [Gluconobacter thailandicus NBRC 3257]GAN93629.1 D-lactate dehydrogenase/oxidoreductase [Gluconobacter thailandicus F149-1 = NBRC 100600]GEL87002.1 oxidoreductase [Gluconobacter thailandicus F149-1 = NBRC 100600]